MCLLSVEIRIRHSSVHHFFHLLKYTICLLLIEITIFFFQIPFVVIVQPHLLREKGSVRLRQVLNEGVVDGYSYGSSERVVSVENLAWTILELSPFSTDGLDKNGGKGDHIPTLASQNSKETAPASVKSCIDYIYIENDQFFESDRSVSKAETPNWKAVLRSMKGVVHKGESFVASLADPSSSSTKVGSSSGSSSSNTSGSNELPLFAVADVPFWLIRDLGTCLMKHSQEETAVEACKEIAEKYPKHKRVLRTVGQAIDQYMKRHTFWSSKTNEKGSHHHHHTHHHHHHHRQKQLIPMLLYSKSDDRFDLITLEAGYTGSEGLTHPKHRRK